MRNPEQLLSDHYGTCPECSLFTYCNIGSALALQAEEWHREFFDSEADD